MRFDSKIAIALANDLSTGQKLNVTASSPAAQSARTPI
jgi:hypothetical protein